MRQSLRPSLSWVIQRIEAELQSQHELCAISFQLPIIPFTTHRSIYSFELQNLAEWLSVSPTHPFTRAPLGIADVGRTLIPNHVLIKKIDKLLNIYGYTRSDLLKYYGVSDTLYAGLLKYNSYSYRVIKQLIKLFDNHPYLTNGILFISLLAAYAVCFSFLLNSGDEKTWQESYEIVRSSFASTQGLKGVTVFDETFKAVFFNNVTAIHSYLCGEQTTVISEIISRNLVTHCHEKIPCTYANRVMCHSTWVSDKNFQLIMPEANQQTLSATFFSIPFAIYLFYKKMGGEIDFLLENPMLSWIGRMGAIFLVIDALTDCCGVMSGMVLRLGLASAQADAIRAACNDFSKIMIPVAANELLIFAITDATKRLVPNFNSLWIASKVAGAILPVTTVIGSFFSRVSKYQKQVKAVEASESNNFSYLRSVVP